MPQQLLYTSAPQGVVAGRSGYCTVARSATMREALMLRLEQLSYYQHLSLTGAPERPIFAYRIVDIRGSRFHVLTRLQDAGLDFTGRTNFTAHHLVFTPEEIRQLPAPAIILRDWSGWLGSWTKEPQLLSNENWGNLNSLAGISAAPAHTWQRLAGDAANGYGLLEAKAGTLINADGIDDKETLSLLAESTELMEVRETRRDYKAAAWQYTFTTSVQEQDNPSDFRWRFIHSDSPAFAKLAGAECRPLCSVRPSRWTEEEASLARTGRRKPNFLAEPEDGRTVEGQPITFQAKADGIPHPDYEWYEVDRAGNAKGLVAQGPELAIPSPALGISRYVVRASNSAGEVISRVALLSVEAKVRLQLDRTSTPLSTPHPRGGHIRSAEQIEKNRSRLDAQKAEEMFRRRQKRKVTLGIVTSLVGLVAFAAFVLWRFGPHRQVGTHAISAVSVPETRTLSDSFADWPPQWKDVAVGEIAAGITKKNYSDGIFFLTGAGKDIREKEDSFFFVHYSASNSISFSARLAQTGDESAVTLCGIMFRSSEQTNAPFAFVGASLPYVYYIRRTATGESCTQENHHRVKAPGLFLLLKHEHSNFVAGFSIDNTNWTWFATNSVSMQDQSFVPGFALCSGKSNAPIRANFDSVTINGTKQ